MIESPLHTKFAGGTDDDVDFLKIAEFGEPDVYEGDVFVDAGNSCKCQLKKNVFATCFAMCGKIYQN